jgi:hypothetical protein
MINFELAPERGGKRTFNDLAEAILWSQRQRDAWDRDYRDLIGSFPNHPFARTRLAWDRVVGDLQESHAKGIPTQLTIPDAYDLIADQSPVFVALNWVSVQLNHQAVVAAAAIAGISGTAINWNDANQAYAVLVYERSLNLVLKILPTMPFLKSTKRQSKPRRASRLRRRMSSKSRE